MRRGNNVVDHGSQAHVIYVGYRRFDRRFDAGGNAEPAVEDRVSSPGCARARVTHPRRLCRQCRSTRPSAARISRYTITFNPHCVRPHLHLTKLKRALYSFNASASSVDRLCKIMARMEAKVRRPSAQCLKATVVNSSTGTIIRSIQTLLFTRFWLGSL
jgi:hypothetical protein